MRRALAITGLAVAGLLLLVAMGALAQDDQWPPPEVTVQPHPTPAVSDRGPLPPPYETAGLPAESHTAYDLGVAFGGLLAGLVTGIGGTLGACHLKREADGSYSLTRGPMDWEGLTNQLRDTTAALEAVKPLLEAIQPGIRPSPSPRVGRPPRPRAPPSIVPDPQDSP